MNEDQEKSPPPIKAYDHYQNRCKRLGHTVRFEYCRQENSGLPCRNIADCWFHLVDVVEFLEANYTPEQRETFLKPSKPDKMVTLFDLIEQAKKAPQDEPD